jgi:hypothetical protein
MTFGGYAIESVGVLKLVRKIHRSGVIVRSA